jgi:UDP-N-acetyl-D-mannosaminuronic acid dehydrogenase
MGERDLRVCVVGTGHIGLPLAAVLADVGFTVTGYDTNADFIARVNASGEAGFLEEGLAELLQRNLHRRLTLSSAPPASHDVYLITVGTPLDARTGRPNLARVQEAIRQISAGFPADPLVVLRSTVTIGTTRHVVLPEVLRRTSRFGLAFCPERTVEGRAIAEMMTLPQIIGGLDAASGDRAEALFRTITPSIVRVSTLEAAEMVKLVNNTYRDLLFAFANEIALIAEQLGLAAPELIRAANFEYPRANVARPGFVGGPCLEKDALILIESLRQRDVAPRIIEAARSINGALPAHVGTRLLAQLAASRRSPASTRVLVTGFAFKGRPATEDVRGSAAVPLMRALQGAGVEVWGHDFVVPEKVLVELGARACGLEEGFDGADGAIIMNDHPGYLGVDIARLARTMRAPAFLFDSWNLFGPDRFASIPGLSYGSIGTPFQHV